MLYSKEKDWLATMSLPCWMSPTQWGHRCVKTSFINTPGWVILKQTEAVNGQRCRVQGYLWRVTK
jgi:hypothetical protein